MSLYHNIVILTALRKQIVDERRVQAAHAARWTPALGDAVEVASPMGIASWAAPLVLVFVIIAWYFGTVDAKH